MDDRLKKLFIRGNSISDLIEESDIDPKVWKIIKGIFIGILLTILLTVLLIDCSRGDCARYYDDINKTYTGVIKRKFLSQKHHNFEVIEFVNGQTVFLGPFDEVGAFDWIQPGDSVIKIKGQLLLKAYRNGEENIFQIEEVDCNKYLK